MLLLCYNGIVIVPNFNEEIEVQFIMKFKKSLSILLAVLMAMTAFAVVGASAQENILDRIIVLNAVQGWPSAVTLTNLESGWDEASINWAPFTAATGENNGYLTQRGAVPPTASAEWTVVADGIATPVRNSINEVLPTDRLRIFRHSAGASTSAERLYIQQNPGNPNGRWYGDLSVTLTISALPTDGSSTTAVSQDGTVRISLISIASLTSTIRDAEALLQNRTRYTADFLRDFDRALENARWFINRDVSNSGAAVEAARVELQRQIDRAPDNMHVLHFVQGNTARVFWGAIDIFARIGQLFSPFVSAVRLFINVIQNLAWVLSLIPGF